MKPIHLALTAVLVLGGCRKSQSSEYKPIGPRCPAGELPVGAVVRDYSGSETHYRQTYYGDGQVIDEDTARTPNNEVTLRVSPERIRKLEADLVATGVFAVKEGCWDTREVMPHMGSWSLVVRHRGRVYTYGGSGGDTPNQVRQAAQLVNALTLEVHMANSAALYHLDDAGTATSVSADPPQWDGSGGF